MFIIKESDKWITHFLIYYFFRSQETSPSEITVCMKSLRNSIVQPEIVVGVMVIAGKQNYVFFFLNRKLFYSLSKSF